MEIGQNINLIQLQFFQKTDKNLKYPNMWQTLYIICWQTWSLWSCNSAATFLF